MMASHNHGFVVMRGRRVATRPAAALALKASDTSTGSRSTRVSPIDPAKTKRLDPAAVLGAVGVIVLTLLAVVLQGNEQYDVRL